MNRVETRRARVILDLLLAVVGAAVIATLVLGRLVPLTGATTLIVAGRSMEPAIPLGSAAVAVLVRAAEIRVGDVVSVRVDDESAVVTHRVVRLIERDGARWLETKGDATAEADAAIVPASAVVGRVAVTIPVFGYLLWLLSIPVGIVFLVGLSATLFVAARLVEADAGPAARVPGRVLVRELG